VNGSRGGSSGSRAAVAVSSERVVRVPESGRGDDKGCISIEKMESQD
jgi:hypothetical protein